jgi:hypothetical protein
MPGEGRWSRARNIKRKGPKGSETKTGKKIGTNSDYSSEQNLSIFWLMMGLSLVTQPQEQRDMCERISRVSGRRRWKETSRTEMGSAIVRSVLVQTEKVDEPVGDTFAS